MPFKVRDEELKSMNEHDLLILLHERSSEMKADLAFTLSKVLIVCEKENALENRVTAIESKCVGHQSEQKTKELDSRLTALEDQRRLVDLTWSTVKSNNVLRALAVTLGSILVGVYWGRVTTLTDKYGLHAVVIGLLVCLLALFFAWLGNKFKRELMI